MKAPAQILASESVSAVDDVVDKRVVIQHADPFGEQPDAIPLGGGYIQIGEYVFYEDWDEIDPPGADDEPETPHEVVMARFRESLKKTIESDQ